LFDVHDTPPDIGGQTSGTNPTGMSGKAIVASNEASLPETRPTPSLCQFPQGNGMVLFVHWALHTSHLRGGEAHQHSSRASGHTSNIGLGPAPASHGAQNQAMSSMRRGTKGAAARSEPADGDENPRQVSVCRHGGWCERPSVSRSESHVVHPTPRRAAGPGGELSPMVVCERLEISE